MIAVIIRKRFLRFISTRIRSELRYPCVRAIGAQGREVKKALLHFELQCRKEQP
jgi:hypothetical protein